MSRRFPVLVSPHGYVNLSTLPKLQTVFRPLAGLVIRLYPTQRRAALAAPQQDGAGAVLPLPSRGCAFVVSPEQEQRDNRMVVACVVVLFVLAVADALGGLQW